MSTRWYPLYQRGNPQLRVYLPNFWLKLVRPTVPQPPNVVQFICSIEMTKHDVKNYLEKIYNVKTVDIRTRIALGKNKKDRLGYVVKEDDVKYAYATLPKDQTFEFPNIFPSDQQKKLEDDRKSLEQTKDNFKNYIERNKDRPGTPTWFSF